MGREVGRKRPEESEVTDSIKAPDPLHRSGLSRAAPFKWEANLRIGRLMKMIKKRQHSAILSLRRHLTFLMTFEPL